MGKNLAALGVTGLIVAATAATAAGLVKRGRPAATHYTEGTGTPASLRPARLRNMQAFRGDRALKAAQLSAELSDLPPASLQTFMAFAAGLLATFDRYLPRGDIDLVRGRRQLRSQRDVA